LNTVNKYFNRISGFFKAPATADYQFHMSCDDICQLYLNGDKASSLVPSQDPSTTGTDPIIDRAGGSTSYTFRAFDPKDFENDCSASSNHCGSVYSEWISLNANEYYFIEAHHQDYSGSSHVTVGVEIKEDPNTGSPKDQSHPALSTQR
jgi:hypothetical protein